MKPSKMLRKFLRKFIPRTTSISDPTWPISGPYEYISPFELPRTALPQFHQDQSNCVYVVRPARDGTFTRHKPLFYDDPDETGLFHEFVELKMEAPPIYVMSFRNAYLVGARTILTSDRRFVTDEMMTGEAKDFYLQSLSQLDRDYNEETDLRPTSQPTAFTFAKERSHLGVIDDEVIVLSSREPTNYGSHLFRVIPKLCTLAEIGVTRGKVLVPGHASPAVKQLLELCGVQEDRIFWHYPERVYALARAIVPGNRNPSAYVDEATHGFYQNISRALVGKSRSRKLYVSRLGYSNSGRSTRAMTNERELIDRLRLAGFEIIEPEELSAKEQVLAFSSAELIVAPAGSSLFNLVFCRPGTKLIDIESEPHWIHAHLCLFSSCKLRFGIFAGKIDPTDPRPVHKRWSVNISGLLERVATFEKV